MAARREQLGEPPTPEELLDYRDGRLEDAERERVEAKIDAFPEAARALADLAAFPDVEAVEGVEEVSDEELSDRWDLFRDRLDSIEASRAEVGEAPRPEADVLELPSRPDAARWWSFPKLAAAAAVVFGLGLGSGVVVDQALRKAPAAANVVITQLAPHGADAQRAGERRTVEVTESTGGWVLVLGLINGLGAADYSARILDSEGAEVWSRKGLSPTPVGTFNLAFGRGFLPSGDYELILSGREATVATYAFRLIRE